MRVKNRLHVSECWKWAKLWRILTDSQRGSAPSTKVWQKNGLPHYVDNGLRGPTAATTGSSGRGTPSRAGGYGGPAGVATHCAPMVQWFNQQPLKKLKFLKLAQNQNRHQKRIPQVKTNQMSARTSELQSCFMIITTSDSGCLPPFQWHLHLVNLCDLHGWPLQMG